MIEHFLEVECIVRAFRALPLGALPASVLIITYWLLALFSALSVRSGDSDATRGTWGVAIAQELAAPLADRHVTERADSWQFAPKKKAWERRVGGQEAAKARIQARLLGWPQELLTDRRTLPQTDEEFVHRLARDTWRGIDALSDREHGLPINHVRFGGSVALADARIGDYASGTDIGLYLMAIVAASDLNFISRSQAIDKIQRTLDSVAHLETYHGFLFNYYDTTSLERTSDFVSFVDSAWLVAGLMVVRTSLPELAARCTHLIASKNFGFFYDPATRRLSQGYYTTPRKRSPFTYGVLYSEARIGSLIAIGKGDVPEDLWFRMVRTFPAGHMLQTMTPLNVRTKTVRGHRLSAGYYEWEGLKYVPSWGGSMFEALMPTLVLDEAQHAPRSLGANDQVHAVLQQRYALEALHYPVWGISPCTTADGHAYAEFGVKVLGSRGYAAGPVTPHAAALALAVAPQAALANLRQLAERYDSYGDYGFYDAIDPRSGAVAHSYLTLDQSMLFVAVANYIGDHCIQKRFASDLIMQEALPIISDEDFFN